MAPSASLGTTMQRQPDLGTETTTLAGRGQRLNWTKLWHGTEFLDTGPDEDKAGLFPWWDGWR